MRSLEGGPMRANEHPTGTSDGPRVFQRTTALPRAYWVDRVQVAQDAGAALDLLTDPNFDPRRSVVLEERPSETSERSGRALRHAVIRIRTDDVERVVVEVDAPGAGFLVLTDADYPGWRASLGGAEVGGPELEILRANAIFRAVAVPAGSSTVRFEDRPVGFRVGIGISLVAADRFFVLACVGLRGRAA